MDVHLKSLYGRYHKQFGLGPGLGPGSNTCLMKVEGVTPPFIKSLYRAAAALYRTDPWKRFRPGHFFGVRVGKDSEWSGKQQPFPCVQFIGGDDGDLAFYLFRSETDAQNATQSRETVPVPNTEIMRVTFEEESLLFSSHRKMIKTLALEPSGIDHFPVFDAVYCTLNGELRFRNPMHEELVFVFAALRGMTLVHPLLEEDVEATPKWSQLMSFEPLIETVDVQWPSELAKRNDVTAVTISHPPGQAYEEKTNSSASSTPTKYTQLMREDVFASIEERSDISLRLCTLCEIEFPAEQSLPCSRCHAVVYCGLNCQMQHWKEFHKSMCGLYKAMMEREEELAMKIFMFPCSVDHPCKWLESLGLHNKGMWRRKCGCCSNYPFGLLPVNVGLSELWGGLDEGEHPQDSPLPNLLSDGISSPILLSGWSEYYNLRLLPLSSPVSDILSHPLTVYYILTALSISTKNLLLNGKEVIVHYLDPKGELDWLPAFAEIGHLLNGTGNIQIVMVGHEVPTSLSGTTSVIGNRIRINLARGIYQEEASYLPSPHVIIALNCGLESSTNWSGALEIIKLMGIPTFFSVQSELACTNVKQVLRSVGLHITHPVTPNPFRSPVKNCGLSTNVPSYSSAFVLGANT